MLLGLFLRNIKAYRGVHFIPLAAAPGAFCSIVGRNGVGKSAILEALDYYFNLRGNWNYHFSVKKDGFDSAEPYVAPVFWIPKNDVPSSCENDIGAVSDYLCSLTLSNKGSLNSRNMPILRDFVSFRDRFLSRCVNRDEYFFVLGGVNYKLEDTNAIFPSSDLPIERIKKINKFIRNLLDYVYIPKDIEPEKMMRLETEEFQRVAGKTLESVVADVFPWGKISELNKGLLSFTKQLSEQLDGYEFKRPRERQDALRKENIYSLILDFFFKKRTLHRKINGEVSLEASMLSSGEKQQSIIDLYCKLVEDYRDSNANKKLILAIDEPEASLHISNCFSQFERLFRASARCAKVFCTSHWYGFVPSITDGTLVCILRDNDSHKIEIFDISSYREEIRKKTVEEKNSLPIDVILKSRIDFVQAIFAGMLLETPYNWIICEGSSDKEYLSAYLRDEQKKYLLRIVPVGGIHEVRNVYKALASFLLDDKIKSCLKGKVYFICDTDEEVASFKIETQNGAGKHATCKRLLLRDSGEVVLVKPDATEVSPATCIEDILDSKLAFNVLTSFKEENKELSFLEDELRVNSLFFRKALDLKESEKILLKSFFEKEGMKLRFAQEYVRLLAQDSRPEPCWIREIKDFFGFELTNGSSE